MAEKCMTKTTFKRSNVKQDRTRVDKIVDNMTLFDDALMSRVFSDNVKATELVLRIILQRNIKVTAVTGQYEIKNAYVGGRTIRLDIRAIDENGESMDIEVQGNAEGSHVRRARYHSSMLDTRLLKKRQAFKNLRDSYVIFMYKDDKFERGLPVYHIHRTVDETGENFGDGSHIIYVNGKYNGDNDIGKLVSDFHQTDPDSMHYDVLAEGLKHYKTVEGGRENMSETLEQYAKEYADECMTISVANLMENKKWTLEEALNALGIQGESRNYISERIQEG